MMFQNLKILVEKWNTFANNSYKVSQIEQGKEWYIEEETHTHFVIKVIQNHITVMYTNRITEENSSFVFQYFSDLLKLAKQNEYDAVFLDWVSGDKITKDLLSLDPEQSFLLSRKEKLQLDYYGLFPSVVLTQSICIQIRNNYYSRMKKMLELISYYTNKLGYYMQNVFDDTYTFFGHECLDHIMYKENTWYCIDPNLSDYIIFDEHEQNVDEAIKRYKQKIISINRLKFVFETPIHALHYNAFFENFDLSILRSLMKELLQHYTLEDIEEIFIHCSYEFDDSKKDAEGLYVLQIDHHVFRFNKDKVCSK